MNAGKKRPSMRAAINAKCRECIYDAFPGNGTWRQQVEACTDTGYALYRLRPLPIKSNATHPAEDA